jgi:hypothetical protein
MSPEQITNAPLGVAADLYALGATLYEALTGRLPFLGPDLVAQHLGETPPSPTSVRSTLRPVHDQTLLRALAKAPSDRFGSAAEMADAVAGWPVDSPESFVGALPTARMPDAGSSESGLRRAESAADDDERELWRAPGVRLITRRDVRTGRQILIEERDAPLDDAVLERVRRLAAAGGPHVQRILRLGDDRRSVWYESLDGPPLSLDALEPAEIDQLAGLLRDLPPGAARQFVRTPAGPVLLVAPTSEDEPPIARPAAASPTPNVPLPPGAGDR